MTATRQTRKRRRPPPPDWDLPVLSAMGLKPSQQRLLAVIGSVAGVVVAAVVLTVVIASLGADSIPDRPQAATDVHATRPQIFHGWSSPKEFAPMADRAKDAKPLTVKEIFGTKTLAGESKLSLKLVARTVEADCSLALWGEELLTQVAEAGCSQAARGIYTSADGRYVAQYTLLNLADGKAADGLVASLKTMYRGGWALPVATRGATFTPGGYSEAGAYAMGHYVGLVWVARTDGAEPQPKDDFVNVALTVRGAEKPLYRRVVTLTGPSPS
ncbi:hypothetical protein [Nonomuraea sp. NPDC046570]|uniref:hypothetical protein n=1 Tax=Nonomuraea sp. NPDC046570 TaxID=3155255 RepID=UPI0033F0FE15